jgi:single-stranded DNA-binding protein
MADINKVWLSGLVVTQPVLTKLSSKTPFSTFTIQVNERFINHGGHVQLKPNLIRVESLGKSAENTVERVRQGARFSVDGYLRQDLIDGVEQIRVRSFAVYPDDSVETVNYKEGLKQAIEVIKRSRDLSTALKQLEELSNL